MERFWIRLKFTGSKHSVVGIHSRQEGTGRPTGKLCAIDCVYVGIYVWIYIVYKCYFLLYIIYVWVCVCLNVVKIFSNLLFLVHSQTRTEAVLT